MSHKCTQSLLLKLFEDYPKAQIQDVFKFLHQSTFGCEHMVTSLQNVIDYIKKERETVTTERKLTEPLDGEYSRVYLSYIGKGLSEETLGQLFMMSAKKENGEELLVKKLCLTEEMIKSGQLPLSHEAFALSCERWKNDGFPALHHSEVYREEYHPAYRVISNEYVRFLPLFAKIDVLLKKGAVRLCIEGACAGGKSTLSTLLEKLYDCTVFHMDDFFLRPEQRTAERLAEVGGNVDRERFLQEVLIPLSKNETVKYRRFDCSQQKILPPVSVAPEKLTVIEGVYSMHSELKEYYDFSVFLDIDKETQKKRILKRNTSEMAERFFNEWIPLEDKYFDGMNVKDRCDMIVSIRE